MSDADLTNPIFTDEEAARAHYEAIRWPNGPVCPHCGAIDSATQLKGKSTRAGVYKCRECEKPFSATVGTVFERSHIPLNKWLLAMHLLCSSKKGMSAHQLHRMLGVTYKTAWFMAHRIREAMDDKGASGPLGGEGKTIEADETYFGPPAYILEPEGWRVSRDLSKRMKVVALVERGGRSRARKVDNMTLAEVRNVLVTNADRKSRLMTDEATFYPRIGREFASHETVNHGRKEYVRGDATTNTVEGYFSIFKRGMKGVYQHCSEKHLQRYLHEFDFRYSNRIALGVDDSKRAMLAAKGAEGKRLTYRQPRERAHF